MSNLYTLEAELAEFKKILEDFPIQILINRGLTAVDIARATVRVDTGTLRSDIRLEIRRQGAGGASVSVVAGGQAINPKSGKICDYAQVVESRYPFLFPAVNSILPMIKSDLEALHK